MTAMQSSPQPKGVSDAFYNRLKLTAQLLLPALATLYFALAQIWGLPYESEITGSIAAVNVFVGVAVAWLKSVHTASGVEYDGTFTLEPTEDGSNLRLLSVDPVALQTKGTVVFKMLDPPPA